MESRRCAGRLGLGLAVLAAALLVAWPAGSAQASCPVNCGTWCCEAGFTCGQSQCCIPATHGDECPSGSCAWCPATTPSCVGWPGTNYTCCARDNTKCNIGSDVWCCPKGSGCGAIKGTCK